ncbi:reverse transcriptase domain-containing protein [Tanacetum coccineum]
MRTRSQTRNRNRRQQQQTLPVVVEPCNLEEPIPGQTIVAMADRTMEELLRAPTEGYGEAIVLPEINADHFEIKTNLLQLVQANPFHELTQVDTFYNGLTENEQDSLNAAAGGNLLSKTTREALNIIENKSKVRYSRNKTNASRVNSRENVSKTDERIDKLADQLSTLVEIVSKKVVVPPAPVKAVEENCVTCGGAHVWILLPVQNQNTLQNNLQNMLSSFFQAQASPSGTLPSNTIPNPKGEMKAITTRSGVAYEGPSNPTKPSPKKVVERETEEITDEEQNNFQGSTAQIPPPVIPNQSGTRDSLDFTKSTPIPETRIPETSTKGKMEICYALADLGASINLMPLSIWKKLSLPELSPTRMTLELADRSITYPKGLAEDVYVKVGKFHFPADFVVVDFEADPRVPLILGRSFLKTGRTLIDVYEGEITLRVDNEAVTFNLDQTMKYSSTNDKSVNRIDIIDEICEEYVPELFRIS